MKKKYDHLLKKRKLATAVQGQRTQNINVVLTIFELNIFTIQVSFAFIIFLSWHFSFFSQNFETSLLSFLDRQQFDFIRGIFTQPTTFNAEIISSIQYQLQSKKVQGTAMLCLSMHCTP